MSGLLLDTHTLLWALSDPDRLGPAARLALTDPGRERWVSVATVWEMAIKSSMGKLVLGVPLGRLVRDTLPACGLSLLDVRPDHAAEVEHLPFHHRDPFDRLLVAQVRVEGLALVSRDAQLDAYGVSRIW
ncbi:MAG: type II toxin-antitoxin system VapC family toxin [Myxococcota bacterium]